MNEILRFLNDSNIEYTVNYGRNGNYATLSFKLHGMEFTTYIDNETTLDDFKTTINEEFKLELINQRKYYLSMAESLEKSINKLNSVF